VKSTISWILPHLRNAEVSRFVGRFSGSSFVYLIFPVVLTVCLVLQSRVETFLGTVVMWMTISNRSRCQEP